MLSFIRKRAVASLISLIGLVVMVFFLSRLTGDPAALFLPVEAPEEMKNQFRELHGLNDPLLVQFGRYVGDIVTGDLGQSLRKARPALDVVLEAFVWTLWLAVITMSLVTVAAIVVGALAAFRVGGFFDRLSSIVSLVGASVPDFWLAIVAIVVFAVNLAVMTMTATGGRNMPHTSRKTLMISISTQRLTSMSAMTAAMVWVMKSEESAKAKSSAAAMIIMIITLSRMAEAKMPPTARSRKSR